MLSWCNLEWWHMHASCRWSQAQWIVLWDSQNGQSLLWNQWAVNRQGVCTTHDSLISKAANNKKEFSLVSMQDPRNLSPVLVSFFFSFFFLWGLVGVGRVVFLSLPYLSLCLFPCLTCILCMIDTYYNNMMSAKHDTLDGLCLWKWQWKQYIMDVGTRWATFMWSGVRAVGRHCQTCLPSALLATLARMMTWTGTDRYGSCSHRWTQDGGWLVEGKLAFTTVWLGCGVFWIIWQWAKDRMQQCWVAAQVPGWVLKVPPYNKAMERVCLGFGVAI